MARARGGLRFCLILALLCGGMVAASAQTQAAMDRQATREFHAADHHLNLVYAQVIAGLDPHRQMLLRQAERDWVTFRDAECAFRTAGSEGGTIHPLLVTACRTQLTTARAEALAKSVCKAGDPTCQ
ncbi:MAG: lysozyme inhibitor LprI family protein [Acidiphilium sp.]|nr:lysozyme inhibitor LprI family protein [Acidiphilium sp.]MDD4935184.1 lysozyme inhibitor LprI family protein [Acidiphilium sp.]